MKEYNAAVMDASVYFTDVYYDLDHIQGWTGRARRWLGDGMMPTFKRWMSIYYGLEVDFDPVACNGSIIVVNVRDPEKATMFKLRF